MRILFVDDRPADVALLVGELERLGFDLEHARVDSAAALCVALEDPSWSAVISEYEPAGLGPLGVVRLVREHDRDLPILLVSGTVDEDCATEALLAGANDFFVKSRLHRLGPALERELRDVQLRQERRALFEGVRRVEGRSRRLFESMPVGIGITTLEGQLIQVNDAFSTIHAIPIPQLVGTYVAELGWNSKLLDEWTEHQYVRADGLLAHTRVSSAPVLDDDGDVTQLIWMVEDVTTEKQREDELRSHKEQLDDAQRMARLGSFVLDLATNERVWSDELYRIWGLAPGDALSPELVESRIHPDDLERFLARRHAVVRLHTPYAGDYRIILADGEGRTVHERGRVLLDERNQATHILGVVQDVTEGRLQEAELQRRAVQQALVANLGQAALSGEPIETLFASAVDNVARLLDVGHCEIWQTNGDRFRLISSLGWKDTGGLEIDRASETQADETVRSGAPVIVEDLTREPRLQPSPFLLRAGIVSGLTVPISAGSVTTWGVLGAHATSPRRFPATDVDFLRSVATILGQAVERDRVDKRLVLHAAQQSAIAELSRIALTSAEDAIPRACTIVREAVEADSALFLEFDEATRFFHTVAGAPTVPDLSIPLEGSQSGLTLERNAPVLIEDYKVRPLGPWAGLGMASGVTVPVASNAHRFGVLTAHSRTRRGFDDAQVDLMKSLANILADSLEREHGRRALAASEARYRAVVEGASEIIFTATDDGVFTAINAQFQFVTGWNASDWIGRSIADLIDLRDRPHAATLFNLIVRRRKALTIELTVATPKGSILLDVTCCPRVEQGKTIGIYGFAHDITESRKATLEQERLTRSLQLLLESTAEGILTIDREGRCTMANGAAAHILGRRPDELVGADLRTLLPGEQVTAILAVVGTGQVHTSTDSFLRGDGRAVPVEYSAAPVIDNGLPVGVVVSFSDVSERQRLEARLEQADRLSSLGRLAATVAHEFNNVLMGISPFIEVMRRGRNIETSLDHIARAVKRGKRITEDILRFTQPAEPLRAAIDTASWVQTMMAEARTLLPRSCELDWEVQPRDLLIDGDANQLHQIFSNLILNARDAMPTGGRLSIRVQREQNFAHFAVSDTGAGMSPETLRHIFEPFFTTKKNGTGLGLPVAHQVVERHGGRMRVESAVGIGTTFHIHLPLAEEDALVAAETSGATLPLDVPPRILLVEDDEAVALGLIEILRMENLRVEHVTTGRAAIEAIDAFPPDLVLLDVGLPDMEGTAVYSEIHARHPDVAVIFSTGHGDRSKLEVVLERPNVGYLLKPYESSALLKAIREVL